jgi:hypothetical protein
VLLYICSCARWSNACARTALVRAPRLVSARFGSTLNPPLHFHCVVIDGMFDAAAAGGVIFRAATGVGAPAIAAVQQCVRRRLLRLFVRRGLLPADDARAMAQWQHGGGFSVDASVRIEAADRAGRERLLRYCARPPFALERLRQLDGEQLSYDHPKSGSGGSGPQILTPLKLLDRLAAVVPPPRVHRHRLLRRARAQLTAALSRHRPRAGSNDLAAHTQPGTHRRTGASSCRPLRLGAAARPHR